MSVKRSSAQADTTAAGTSQATRRARNPQGQGGRLRDELVAAADRLLAMTGDVEGLSLRAIAREVGAATPSIYLYFPDKRALVRAVIEARFAEFGGAIRAAVESTPEPVDRFRAGCLAYCQFATEHPNAYRILFGRVPAQPSPPEPLPVPSAQDAPSPSHSSTRGVRGRGERVPSADGSNTWGLDGQPGAAAFGFLADSIQACMRAGLATPGDPMRAAINVWTALHGIVSLRASLPSFPWPPLTDQIDDALAGLVGLRPNPHARDEDDPEGRGGLDSGGAAQREVGD